ncbi:site-2 protease family protein [Actinoallomurus sp. NPDC052308]|uniref:M50 family metallopeptidase n=1 Tax=Actinoallomurus sp. NPDC052308 TaxID=3155530 RepID=UPI00342539F2
MSVLFVVGIVVFFLGLLASIALHELGHMSFAKLFGVRVPQFMVGFGPTMWSRRKGETEYGVKWIPLGGYIRMIGMLPPRRGDAPGTVRQGSTGPFQGLIESARGAALEEVGPGDEDRVFYRKKWWQKVIIMFAGPFMNILLAFVFISVVVMGIGISTLQPVIDSVSKCTIPAAQAGRDCQAGDPVTPAVRAGLRPGDRIVSYEGHRIHTYAQLQGLIRGSGGRTVPVVVHRGGQDIPLSVPVTTNQMQSLTDPDKTETVGFLGISPTSARERQGPGLVVSTMTDLTKHTFGSLIDMPKKMVGVWNAAFSDKKRDPNGPIGVVGASRIGGEIAASKEPGLDKLAFFLMMLGTVNFAVGMFNLVPLLPLDGGHIAGALWEAVKKGIARVTRRPDPGHVDVAKALPLTYAMAAVIITMGALLIYADLVNPVRLNG